MTIISTVLTTSTPHNPDTAVTGDRGASFASALNAAVTALAASPAQTAPETEASSAPVPDEAASKTGSTFTPPAANPITATVARLRSAMFGPLPSLDIGRPDMTAGDTSMTSPDVRPTRLETETAPQHEAPATELAVTDVQRPEPVQAAVVALAGVVDGNDGVTAARPEFAADGETTTPVDGRAAAVPARGPLSGHRHPRSAEASPSTASASDVPVIAAASLRTVPVEGAAPAGASAVPDPAQTKAWPAPRTDGFSRSPGVAPMAAPVPSQPVTALSSEPTVAGIASPPAPAPLGTTLTTATVPAPQQPTAPTPGTSAMPASGLPFATPTVKRDRSSGTTPNATAEAMTSAPTGIASITPAVAVAVALAATAPQPAARPGPGTNPSTSAIGAVAGSTGTPANAPIAGEAPDASRTPLRSPGTQPFTLLTPSAQAPTQPLSIPSGPVAAAPAPLAAQVFRPIFNLASAGDGKHTITVSVNPDNLGPVTVQAHVSGKDMRIELFAPTDVGRDAIRAILPDLRRDMAGAGISGGLDLSGRNQPDAQAGSGRGDQNRAWDRPQSSRQEPTPADQIKPPHLSARGAHSTALDVLA